MEVKINSSNNNLQKERLIKDILNDMNKANPISNDLKKEFINAYEKLKQDPSYTEEKLKILKDKVAEYFIFVD